MRLNGVAKVEDMKILADMWAGMSDRLPTTNWLSLEDLSWLANIGRDEFFSSHSMLQFYEFVDLSRERCSLCETCIESDLLQYGQSYWRRAHQIPGLLWCPEHESPLRWVFGAQWFYKSPAEAIEVATAAELEFVREALDNPYIVRYVGLALKLLERSIQFDDDSISNTLLAEASRQEYSMYAGRFSITHMLHDAEWRFGRKWLDGVMPLYKNRKKKTSFWCRRYRGVFEVDQRQSSSLMECLIACTLLYESEEEALCELSRYIPTPKWVAPKYPFLLDKEKLVRAYLVARGNYRRVENQYRGRSRIERIQSGLQELGLPHLVEGCGKSSLRALMAFYLDGRSLADSAAVGGMAHSELESLLRESSILLRSVLKEIKSADDEVIG